ncbi:Hypothetical predicted protein [Olea europaea subsp. europaea]|uniref:Uncharacterized protein n=1 Tax=Olea europaea subsp. europaea TaxID=158383 RepID=A0A8S0QKC4_OLEEU|nr:Hypothetical predicted protein [Olea europaea subsp. europaea]
MQSTYTDSYNLGHGDVDSVPKCLGGYDIGACHEPSLALQYLSTNTRKDGGFQSVDELHLAKQGRAIHSRDNCYLGKKYGHLSSGDKLNLDEFVGPIDRKMYKYNWKDKLLTFKSKLRGDVDHTMSSSWNRDYARGHLVSPIGKTYMCHQMVQD